MGSSGYGFDLSPVEGREQSSRGKLYDAARELVLAHWQATIPSTYREHMGEWLRSDAGESLMTVGDEDEDRDEPADGLLFMFYETVSWPSELAGHWLHLAL